MDPHRSPSSSADAGARRTIDAPAVDDGPPRSLTDVAAIDPAREAPDSRYAAALGDVVGWLEVESSGWTIVQAPPTEQLELASYLAGRFPGRPVIELETASGRTSEQQIDDALACADDAVFPAGPPGATAPLDAGGGGFLVLAPGASDRDAPRLLVDLAGRRDRLARRGAWVLVMSRGELGLVERHAPTLIAGAHRPPRIAFLPRRLADDELAVARAALAAHYRRRFERVALAAFLPEPAEILLADLVQPLDALEIDDSAAPGPTAHPVAMGTGTRVFDVDLATRVRLLAEPAPIDRLLARPRTRPTLIVGGPGAGKSALLARLAIDGASPLAIDGAIAVHLPLAAATAELSLADQAIEALLADGLAIAHAIADQAAAGRVVFLLDGLDEAGADLQPFADAIAELARMYPAARVLVTARPHALDGVRLAADRLQLEGLADDAIAALLARWCELSGATDGARLAGSVLGSPPLHDLAASPLQAALLAIIHRAGLRLPERKVELYDRLLERAVARWNQLRPRADDGPLGVPDLIRLLAPIAAAMVDRGRAALDEHEVRGLLARPIARGCVRGVTDVDDTLALLRGPLGLLVERAPGLYAFVHASLGDHLAARLAVRGQGLEQAIADPARCFSPRWHEPIRHALGVLGTLEGNDDRLDATVRQLVDRARAARGQPTALVAELLGGILIDDPALTPELATAICDELVPAWWFDGTPTFDGDHSGTALADRILVGPWAHQLAGALHRRYQPGWGAEATSGLRARIGPLGLLRRLQCPLPLLLCEALVASMVRDGEPAPGPVTFTPLLLITPQPDDARQFVRLALTLSGVATLMRFGAGRLFFAALPADGVDPTWRRLDDGVGVPLAGRLMDAPPRGPVPLTGTIHITVRERPDRALLPNVIAAWRALAERYPTGPRPPDSVDDAVERYGAIAVN